MGNFDIRTGNVPDSEKELEKALRPLSFSDFRAAATFANTSLLMRLS